jgi:hypothetical protein
MTAEIPGFTAPECMNTRRPVIVCRLRADGREAPRGFRFMDAGEVVTHGDLTFQRDGSTRHPFGYGFPVDAENYGRYIRPDLANRRRKHDLKTAS